MALSAADSSSSKWVIAAEKFAYNSAFKEDSSVADGIAQMFPNRIMEKLDEDWSHTEYPDERLEKTLYNLRKDRLSLFLQLSSEYKKRDSLILQNYSKGKLKAKVRDADKSIEELADMLEVMYAIAKARGWSVSKLEAVRREKAEKRGAFEKRIFLERVDDDE